ncbi:MAG: T9SS type A sorting domain-containing protein [Ferruginibacter sp.]
MKKCIILITLFISVQLNAQLYVNTGAEIKLTSGALLTINDIDLVNNGTFNQTTGTVRFTGNTNTNISGTQTPVFNILEMAKGTNNRVLLQRTVNVGNQINFVSGILDLNNNNILLSANAFLNSEDETSRITGTTGGYVEITSTLNAPTIANPGNLGATITSTANMGSTIIRRGHKSQTNASGGGNSTFRYYDILPANNTSLNATLNFKYFDAELNGLQENILTLWKSLNTTIWADQGFDRKSIITNYVEKWNISDFSRWTLSTPGNPLPVLFTLFNVKCNNSNVVVSWKTAQERNSSHFQLQRSTGGSNWTVIATIPAAGFSNTERSYTFTDSNPVMGISFYRVIEFDNDGKEHHTAVLKNDCGNQTDDFKVWPNPVQQDLYVNIHTISGSQLSLKLFDSKGALVKEQHSILLAGDNLVSIPVENLAKGIYHLLAEWDNANIRKSQKIIRQ